MKKLYTVAIAAFAAVSASAAPGEWVTIEDFEGKTEAKAYNIYGSDPAGTVTIEVVPTTDNATNHAAKFVGGDYNTIIEVSVTLPDGKVASDYSNIAFDLYRFEGDDNYKKMLVYIDAEKIYEDDSYVQQAEAKTWTQKSYEIPEAVAAGNKLAVRCGIATNKGEYAIDNIRFREKAATVAPGTYYDTKNGTLADGWLMLQDYQTKAPGDEVALWGRYGSVSATAVYAVDPTDSKNLVAEYTGGSYNDYINVVVTLPEGKTLADYKAVAFDFYRYADDEANKKMLVWLDSENIYEDEGYPDQGAAETWIEKSYSIPETLPEELAAANSFALRYGLSTNAGHYAVDKLRLQEKGGSDGIADITADENAPVEYFNLQGIRVAEPQAGQLVIRRQGSKVTKILVK